jgi:outer membrane protein TolC
MQTHSHVLGSLVVATCLVLCGAAPAADEEGTEASALDYSPPVHTSPTISLIDAVRVTLEHQPNIRLQSENELLRAGLAQQATGQFDTALSGDLGFDHTQQEVSDGVSDSLVQETSTGNLNLGLTKQLRSGPVLSPFLNMSGTSLDFDGPAIPGTSTIDVYTSAIGFKVDLPLARGRGVASTGAAEKSATIDYEASLATTTHTASLEVLQTTNAYWTLLAAQRSLEVLERSQALNQRLLELSEAMVKADEMARSELARARARDAEARARVEEARRALYQARLDFVTTVGFQASDESQAPLAADDFPKPPNANAIDAIDVGDLTDHAFNERRDLAAAKLLDDSGHVLLRAATLNLSPRTDLGLDLSYSGREASNNLEDGVDGILFDDWTGPSGGARLGVEWPIKNNVQRGKLEQQRALYNQSVISTRDLARRIQSNVVLITETLKEAVLQIRQYEEAVGHYRESVKTEVEKFRIGMSTLIQTIFTEQNQIGAELSLISSQSQYAQLLAQLRFESATLLVTEPDGWIVNEENLVALPVVGAQP